MEGPDQVQEKVGVMWKRAQRESVDPHITKTDVCHYDGLPNLAKFAIWCVPMPKEACCSCSDTCLSASQHRKLPDSEPKVADGGDYAKEANLQQRLSDPVCSCRHFP